MNRDVEDADAKLLLTDVRNSGRLAAVRITPTEPDWQKIVRLGRKFQTFYATGNFIGFPHYAAYLLRPGMKGSVAKSISILMHRLTAPLCFCSRLQLGSLNESEGLWYEGR